MRDMECVTACLRFGAGRLAFRGAERLAGNQSRRWDTVRRASLVKAEASRPHSKGDALGKRLRWAQGVCSQSPAPNRVDARYGVRDGLPPLWGWRACLLRCGATGRESKPEVGHREASLTRESGGEPSALQGSLGVGHGGGFEELPVSGSQSSRCALWSA